MIGLRMHEKAMAFIKGRIPEREKNDFIMEFILNYIMTLGHHACCYYSKSWLGFI